MRRSLLQTKENREGVIRARMNGSFSYCLWSVAASYCVWHTRKRDKSNNEWNVSYCLWSVADSYCMLAGWLGSLKLTVAYGSFQIACCVLLIHIACWVLMIASWRLAMCVRLCVSTAALFSRCYICMLSHTLLWVGGLRTIRRRHRQAIILIIIMMRSARRTTTIIIIVCCVIKH